MLLSEFKLLQFSELHWLSFDYAARLGTLWFSNDHPDMIEDQIPFIETPSF